MAKIPIQKKILLEDVPEEDRDWMSKIVIPINQFVSAAVAALTKDLTFGENFRCQIKELTFVNNAASFPLKFQYTLSSRPIAVLKLNVVDISESPAALTSAIDIPDWELSQNVQIQINTITGLVANKKYRLTVLVI